eukprot:TRINITY_DN65761_c11_g10_i1.p1 TRINITY_DN65761_c11_g10~~TRINITY_DN65761_c11_g10_i1.p1  ORF type:complete len:387 (-),score=225.87 TRINITY_DN65761_c11_g10_i1:53-1171(-)
MKMMMTRRTTVLLALTLLVASAALVSAGTGKDKDKEKNRQPPSNANKNPKGFSDLLTKAGQRSLQIKETGAGYGVMVKADDKVKKNRMLFKFSTRGFPRFRAAFFNKEEGEDPSASKFSFRVGFVRIIEFADQGTSGWDSGDSIKCNISLVGKKDWSKVNRTLVTMDDGSQFHRFESHLKTKNGALVRFTVRIADKALPIHGNVTLGPNALKFDMNVENYTWCEAGTKLGFVAKVQTKQDFKRKNEPSEGQGEIGAGNDGAFTFQNNVEPGSNADFNDGGSIDLGVSDLLDENAAGGPEEDPSEDDGKISGEATKKVVFTVGTTNHTHRFFKWDPEIGMKSDLSIGAAGSLTASMTTMLVSVLFALVLMMKN